MLIFYHTSKSVTEVWKSIFNVLHIHQTATKASNCGSDIAIAY